ncbi:MAG TPA: pyridoxamine 5'-phosphate oxidase family protein [Actinomycetota bacterium]|nr:pyridoxamine 5'-phosphate oxidase family protein [Actinomycetota bacterium]
MEERDSTTRTEALTQEECMELLQYRSYVGRVAFIENGRPMVLPVNYLADGGSVVFSTRKGSKLSRLKEAPVAFEVDASRSLRSSGWSVLVQGVAREVTDPEELESLRRGPLKSWAFPRAEHWIRISIDKISGRRIPEI